MRWSYLQKFDEVFYVQVDRHAMTFKTGQVDQHVVTHDVPVYVVPSESLVLVTRMNLNTTYANSGVQTFLRL